MTEFIINKVDQLTADNSRYRLDGVASSCAAGQTTTIDVIFAQERWINGGILVLNGSNAGDYVQLEYVYPSDPEVVVYVFANQFYVPAGIGLQVSLSVPYIALVPAGIILRLKYTNVGITATHVAINYSTHIPEDVT